MKIQGIISGIMWSVFSHYGMAQHDTSKFLVELDVVVSDVDTGVPIVGAKGYLVRDKKDSIFFVSDVNGRIQVTEAKYPGFLIYPANYILFIQGVPRQYREAEEEFAIEDLTTNTRFVRDVRIEPIRGRHTLPAIVFKEKSALVDSVVADSIIYVYDLMIEHPNVIILISSLYDSESEMKLAQKRADAIVNYFVSKGIDAARFQTEIAPRPPVREITNLVTGEVIMRYQEQSDILVKVLSFDYTPKE